MLTVVEAGRPDAALSLDELGSRIVGLAGRLAAATCRWLLLVAEFDAREGWARFGLASTPRWLAHYCGLSRRTAVEHVRVARALEGFPELAEAMAAGRLSFSHVWAISRLAYDGEHRLVADLVDVAEHGTVGQLEAMVRGLRTVEQQSPPLEEYVSHAWSAQSRWRLHARLDPEHGAVVQSAIETLARAEGISHAAALTRMAEIALAAVNDAGAQPRGLRGDERAAVVVHLTVADMCAEAEASDAAGPYSAQEPAEPDAVEPADGDEPERAAVAGARSAERARPGARVAGGPGLPDRVVNRLLCSGRIRTAVHDTSGDLLDLGRSHRVVTDRMFRALLMRDGGCTHPGCGATRGLQAHHVLHWVYGGRTNLANLLLLCEAHHRSHHDGQFRITALGRGRFRFLRHDGRVLPDHVDPSRLATSA